jgi:FdhD protein
MTEPSPGPSIAGGPAAVPGASILAVRGGRLERRADRVVGEEPLQIRACGPGQDPVDVAVTMRTPGHEVELASGFLLTEGLATASDLRAAAFELGDPALLAQPHNEIIVRLPAPFDPAVVAERHFVATASCGICGRTSIDELAARADALPPGPRVPGSILLSLPVRMRDAQHVFEHTGGLHASALFTPAGELVALHEDVGRHNALDKVVGGEALGGRLPLHERVLLVSGRVSFEIVQKAAMAGLPLLCAVSAPSDLAVTTAQRLGLTLVGFLRGDGYNVYAGEERIDPSR